MFDILFHDLSCQLSLSLVVLGPGPVYCRWGGPAAVSDVGTRDHLQNMIQIAAKGSVYDTCEGYSAKKHMRHGLSLHDVVVGLGFGQLSDKS